MFRLALYVVLLALALPSLAQDQTLKIILGYPPGASSDVLTRLLADRMRVLLNQAVVVENKPGAGGIIGNESVKASPPDGSTILLTPVATMAAFPHSHGAALRYDPFRDFEPIAHLTNFQLSLAINAELPAKTVADYVALVKKEAKMGDYASAAAGSLPHYFGVMFAKAAGIDMMHIPYKGTAPALQALAGGEVKAGMFVLADALTLVRSGKARVLAVSGAQRSEFAPDIPTFRELGYPIEGNGWYALFAPAKTPREIIDRYAGAAIEAIRSPDMKARLANMGLEATGLGPAELAVIMRTDYDKWGPVIRASGFKPTQ